MKIELNKNFVKADTDFNFAGLNVSITPPLTKEYWLMRVALSDQQAIVCFPKFGTVGVGFQKEEDWNTNLPYTCPAEEIFNHISHNKSDEAISDTACIDAIKALQSAIGQLMSAKNN